MTAEQFPIPRAAVPSRWAYDGKLAKEKTSDCGLNGPQASQGPADPREKAPGQVERPEGDYEPDPTPSLGRPSRMLRDVPRPGRVQRQRTERVRRPGPRGGGPTLVTPWPTVALSCGAFRRPGSPPREHRLSNTIAAALVMCGVSLGTRERLRHSLARKEVSCQEQVSIWVSIILGLYSTPRTPRTREKATN